MLSMSLGPSVPIWRLIYHMHFWLVTYLILCFADFRCDKHLPPRMNVSRSSDESATLCRQEFEFSYRVGTGRDKTTCLRGSCFRKRQPNWHGSDLWCLWQEPSIILYQVHTRRTIGLAHYHLRQNVPATATLFYCYKWWVDTEFHWRC